MDYMFWTVEDLPNGRGSAIKCIVSIAPPENQKDISVQRIIKYLLPSLRCARSVVTRIFKGKVEQAQSIT